MGFSRQEYWSGLPFPPPGNLPNSGMEPESSALAGILLHFRQKILYLWATREVQGGDGRSTKKQDAGSNLPALANAEAIQYKESVVWKYLATGDWPSFSTTAHPPSGTLPTRRAWGEGKGREAVQHFSWETKANVVIGENGNIHTTSAGETVATTSHQLKVKWQHRMLGRM